MNAWSVNHLTFLIWLIKTVLHAHQSCRDARIALIRQLVYLVQTDTLRTRLQICAAPVLNSKDAYCALARQHASTAPLHITWIKFSQSV